MYGMYILDFKLENKLNWLSLVLLHNKIPKDSYLIAYPNLFIF